MSKFEEFGFADSLVNDVAGRALSPDSAMRMIFVGLGALLIAFDIIMLPLSLAGITSVSEFTESPRMIEQLTFSYWVADLVLTFCTGYHKGVEVVMNCKYIAIHYLKTWFLSDALLLAIDFYFLCQSDYSAGATRNVTGAARMMRLLRVMRILRILRLRKLFMIGNAILAYMTVNAADASTIILRVVRLLLFILLLNHYIACVWYSLGTGYDDGVVTWTRDLEDDSWTLYTSAFHWSITQFTPATQNLGPRNSTERCFAVVVVLLALLSFSTFLGKISTAMTNLLHISSTRDTEMSSLKQYFDEVKISRALRMRIWICWRQRWDQKKQLHMKRHDVPFIAEMPKRLQMTLDMELRAPYMHNMKIFELVEKDGAMIMPYICHFAMQEKANNRMEELFMPRSASHEAVCITSGTLFYESRFCGEPVFLKTGDWVAELCLWGKWVHRGWLVAESSCTRICLNAEQFCLQVAECMGSTFGKTLSRYAHQMAKRVIDATSPVTDVIHCEEELWRRNNMAYEAAPEEKQRRFLAKIFAKTNTMSLSTVLHLKS